MAGKDIDEQRDYCADLTNCYITPTPLLQKQLK